MVAILSGLKFLLFVFPRMALRAMGIGLIFLLLIIALYHSAQQMNPTPFFKEFGGRLFMADISIEQDIEFLKANMGAGLDVSTYHWLMIIGNIAMFYYMVKLGMWVLRNFVFDKSKGDWATFIWTLVIYFVLECFFIIVFVDGWRIPFTGFFSLVTGFVPLIVEPFTNWAISFIPVQPVTGDVNQTIDWWTRIFG